MYKPASRTVVAQAEIGGNVVGRPLGKRPLGRFGFGPAKSSTMAATPLRGVLIELLLMFKTTIVPIGPEVIFIENEFVSDWGEKTVAVLVAPPIIIVTLFPDKPIRSYAYVISPKVSVPTVGLGRFVMLTIKLAAAPLENW